MNIDLGIGYTVPEGPATLELARKLREKSRTRERLADEEVLRGAPRGELFAAIAELHNLPYTPGALKHCERELLERFDRAIMRRALVAPLSISEERLNVAIANPYESIGLDYCRQHHPTLEIVAVMVPTSEIEGVLENLSGGGAVEQSMIDQLEGSSGPEQVIVLDIGEALDMREGTNVVPELVRTIFVEAVNRGASDVHFHAERDRFYYTFRINGDRGASVPLDMKIVSRMDAYLLGLCRIEREEAVKRVGISGRFSVRHASKRVIDCRFERHRSYGGFHVTIRLLDTSLVEPKLGSGSLAFDAQTMLHLNRALRMSDGIIVMSGPTGSGKSTTLRAMLTAVNEPRYNILTLENPVEGVIRGVTHCDMRSNAEFSDYITSFLRSDPDIMLMGEVRDRPSAALALEASLTGHQVFTTIHTNSAGEILDRFVQLGLERADIARTLRLLCAQRLIKKLCHHCALPTELTLQDVEIYGLEPELIGHELKTRSEGGCAHCEQRGYRGRKAVLELLPVDREACRLITEGNPTYQIEERVREKHGLKNLKQYGLEMLLAGESDLAAINDAINLAY